VNKKITLIILLISTLSFGQSKVDFLKENRFDLHNQNFDFPENNFKIIGFGALHGSAKTYVAEIKLIENLHRRNLIDFYVPETNFSQAFFFQKYLETGDIILLKELVLAFQTIVSQEGSIETFNHWKNLKKLNDQNPSQKLRIIGFDIINEYKFPIKHLLHLTENSTNWEEKKKLALYFNTVDTNFGLNNKQLQSDLKSFIEDYYKNKILYDSQISDTYVFNHIIENILLNFNEKRDREKIIYENYLKLKPTYDLENKKQFMKYGYFHIQKTREANYPSFFTRLIESEIYKREEIITVMSYLTRSAVLWDKIYDENKNYKTFTTEKGFGIGDYWKEYFKGIKSLKKSKISDLTLFKLNLPHSPYNFKTDLVEIKMFLKDYNRTSLKGKNTLQFIDYALLISNSEAQKPIQEMR
jgi:hypothetical protein